MKTNRRFITSIVVLLIIPHYLFAQFSKIIDLNGDNGRYPYSDLVNSGDTIFGTTIQGGIGWQGTIFCINIDGTNYQNIYNFSDTNGTYPRGLVIRDKTLYGVTREGGKHYKGNLYKIETNGSNFKTLLTFGDTLGEAPEAPLLITGDTIFGVTGYGGKYQQGVLYRIRTDGSDFKILKDFQINPYGTLQLFKNYLYGVTSGSTEGYIYKIKTDGTNFEIIRDYTGGGTPIPSTSLLLVDSILYGGITYGNTHSDLYKMNTDGTGFKIIHNLTPDILAFGDLVYHNDLIFGLSASLQTIFKIDTSGNNYNVIHYFKQISGDSPVGTLFPLGNYLYGTARQGGRYDYGTIFKFNLIPKHPSIQAGRIKIEDLTCQQMTLKWNRGNGSNCAVFVRENSSDVFPIVDNLSYNANSTFGLGDQIDSSGWYCVYNGIDSSVIVSDIKPAHSYEIRIVEYNVALIGDEKYNINVKNDNPVVLKSPKCLQYIVFDPLPTKMYGDQDITLEAYSTSGLPVSYSCYDTTIAIINSSIIKILGAGTTNITAFQTGDSIYSPANDEIRQLVINKAELIVRASDTTKYIGEMNPIFILDYSGFINSEDTTDLIHVPIANCSAEVNSPPGIYDIIISGGLSNNYNFIYLNAKLIVLSASSAKQADSEKTNIYPTLASDYLYYRNTNKKICHIQIYDLNGNIIFDETNQNNQIDIRCLSKGIYILKLNDISFKFVKI